MKPLILVLLVSIIVFSQCDSNIPIIGKEKKSNLNKFLGDMPMMCYFAKLSGNMQGYKIIDNNDGTLSLAYFVSTGSDFCLPPLGKTETITVQYYIKKCIQGQVYRTAQNDCKGTGTADNYYGAQKLQWCSMNDRSCETLEADGSYILDTTKSPAGISCARETILNKKWGIFPLSFIKKYGDALRYTTDLPSSDSDYYWSIGSVGYGLVQVASYDAGGENWKFRTERFLMTAANYVLCGRGGL